VSLWERSAMLASESAALRPRMELDRLPRAELSRVAPDEVEGLGGFCSNYYVPPTVDTPWRSIASCRKCVTALMPCSPRATRCSNTGRGYL
jgi:hypothetical protein